MTEYQAYMVGSVGHFDGFEPLICDNDDDAIAKACTLLEEKDIELWSGPRLVIRLKSKRKTDMLNDARVMTDAVSTCDLLEAQRSL
jgi:hypothetical protein